MCESQRGFCLKNKKIIQLNQLIINIFALGTGIALLVMSLTTTTHTGEDHG